ncbi:Pupal cuticle protein [Lucilia cuprina]|nr:Pupal cuticle protein [Lucilia cuprina]
MSIILKYTATTIMNMPPANGISAAEQGTGGQVANGGYSYYSPEGEFIQVSYTANEDGFQPSGTICPHHHQFLIIF